MPHFCSEVAFFKRKHGPPTKAAIPFNHIRSILVSKLRELELLKHKKTVKNLPLSMFHCNLIILEVSRQQKTKATTTSTEKCPIFTAPASTKGCYSPLPRANVALVTSVGSAHACECHRAAILRPRLRAFAQYNGAKQKANLHSMMNGIWLVK